MEDLRSDGFVGRNSEGLSPPYIQGDSKAENDEREAIEWHTFQHIVDHLSSGLRLEEVLDLIFEEMRDLVPFDRMGFLAIDTAQKTVRMRWSRSCVATTPTSPDYAMQLSQFGLEEILKTREPLIIGELSTHLKNNPGSEPSLMLLLDGMRSSLMCPVLAGEKAVGFLFFSSLDPHAYTPKHSRIYAQIARHLGFIIEKARLLDELMEMDQLRSRLLGMVAHDLRTPLNVLNGYLYLFTSGVVSDNAERVKSIWSAMQQSVNRMLMMVNQLVDVSAIETGHLKLEPAWIDISNFMQQIYEEMSILGMSHEVKLVWSIESDTGATNGSELFFMDERRMYQVLENLLSNAFKYSNPGDTVEMIFRREAIGSGEFIVKDTGKGISPADQQVLFSDFSRGQIKPALRESSVGLGLAICKRIVEAHNGRIWLVSAPGEGTVVHVMLPGVETENGPPQKIKI